MIAYRCDIIQEESFPDADKYVEDLITVNNTFISPDYSVYSYDTSWFKTKYDNNQYNEIIIGNFIDSCDYLFRNCSNLSANVIVGENVSSAENMFLNCTNLKNVSFLGNKIINVMYMFDGCTNFNSPVEMSDNVTNCCGMFRNCANFNSPVHISNNTTNCKQLFSGCSSFNQPVTFPNSVTELNAVFEYCTNFNQNLRIPDSVIDCNDLFSCEFNYPMVSYTADLILGNNVTNMCYMFYYSYVLPNIYIYGENRILNLYGFATTLDNSTSHHIFGTEFLCEQFANSANVFAMPALVWDESVPNVRYNERYNVYLHNDYNGYKHLI